MKDITVDVGENITSLLERLAQQIGTTADKVFPWYVEQAYLQGITTLFALVAALLISLVVFRIAIKKANFIDGNVWAVASITSGVFLILSLLISFIAGPQQVRKMINPQFYAMTMLAEDIGRMRGR